MLPASGWDKGSRIGVVDFGVLGVDTDSKEN
jgi:hypothetical protein